MLLIACSSTLIHTADFLGATVDDGIVPHVGHSMDAQ